MLHLWVSEQSYPLYGDIDFIPTEAYGIKDAQKAMANAIRVVNLVKGFIIERNKQ